MTKLVKRIQIYAGEWEPVASYDGCCDCGIIYRVEFRVRRGRIEIRSWRADALTKEARRRFKYPCKERRK